MYQGDFSSIFKDDCSSIAEIYTLRNISTNNNAEPKKKKKTKKKKKKYN